MSGGCSTEYSELRIRRGDSSSAVRSRLRRAVAGPLRGAVEVRSSASYLWYDEAKRLSVYVLLYLFKCSVLCFVTDTP